MRIYRLALALGVVLAVPAAVAGPAAKTKSRAARKADTAKKRVVVAPVPARDGECTRVVRDDVSIRELRVVGIVGAGRAQKAVLMDGSDDATMVTRGECVGIEQVPYDDVVKPLRDQLARR